LCTAGRRRLRLSNVYIRAAPTSLRGTTPTTHTATTDILIRSTPGHHSAANLLTSINARSSSILFGLIDTRAVIITWPLSALGFRVHFHGISTSISSAFLFCFISVDTDSSTVAVDRSHLDEVFGRHFCSLGKRFPPCFPILSQQEASAGQNISLNTRRGIYGHGLHHLAARRWLFLFTGSIGSGESGHRGGCWVVILPARSGAHDTARPGRLGC